MSGHGKIARHFDRQARIYDANPITRWIGRHELKVLLSLLPHLPRVLDYGCGTGRVTLELLRQGRRVTGYDLSPGMVAQAEARAQAAGYAAEFTTHRSDLGGRTWPLITSMGVLDYFADPGEFLRELRSLAEPGGWIVFTAPNAASPLARLYVLASRLSLQAYALHPQEVVLRVTEQGLEVERLAYAFPNGRPWAHTLVCACRQM